MTPDDNCGRHMSRITGQKKRDREITKKRKNNNKMLQDNDRRSTKIRYEKIVYPSPASLVTMVKVAGRLTVPWLSPGPYAVTWTTVDGVHVELERTP